MENKKYAKYTSLLEDSDLEQFAESLKNCYFFGRRTFMEQDVVCFCFYDIVYYLNDYDIIFEHSSSGTDHEKLLQEWRKFMSNKIKTDDRFKDYQHDLSNYLLDNIRNKLGKLTR